MNNYVKMELTSKIENVTFLRGVVSCFLLESDLSVNTVNEVKTLISEAVTNAIVHGYKDSEGIVEIILELKNNELIMIIKDDGIGIEDIDKAREPLFTTKPEEERSGLGFTIMDIFSDELEINSKIGEGTKIICKKYLD